MKMLFSSVIKSSIHLCFLPSLIAPHFMKTDCFKIVQKRKKLVTTFTSHHMRTIVLNAWMKTNVWLCNKQPELSSFTGTFTRFSLKCRPYTWMRPQHSYALNCMKARRQTIKLICSIVQNLIKVIVCAWRFSSRRKCTHLYGKHNDDASDNIWLRVF